MRVKSGMTSVRSDLEVDDRDAGVGHLLKVPGQGGQQLDGVDRELGHRAEGAGVDLIELTNEDHQVLCEPFLKCKVRI